MSAKISVIIPVYNVEKYLKKCIDSVIHQTLKDIEIIVINDGSLDKSDDIILEYAKFDSRIRYFKHENIGLGLTRNRGISLARGEYLAFVDSDDYIEKEMLEKLFNKAKAENADVVCGQVCIFHEENKKKIRRKDLSNIAVYSLKQQGKEIFIRNYYLGKNYSHNAWDKIYRTSLIKQNGILFGDNKRIFAEDNYFQLQIIEYADIISFVSEDLYYYVTRNDSIMNTYKKNLVTRHMNMIKDYEKLFENSDDKLHNDICSLIAFEVIIMEALNIVSSGLGLTEFLKSMQELNKSNIFLERIDKLLINKSYLLEPNKMKYVFIKVISTLIGKGSVNFASSLTYMKYKICR